MTNQKGFTIIELIVVIAIIAVLATIVMVNVNSYVLKSKEVSALASIHSIFLLATDYLATNGSMIGFCSSPSLNQAIYSIENSNPSWNIYCMSQNNQLQCNGGVQNCVHNNGAACARSGDANFWLIYVSNFSYGSGCADNTGFENSYGYSSSISAPGGNCVCAH